MTAIAAPGSWTRKTDMPTARRWLAVAAVDGLIYALGGGRTCYGSANRRPEGRFMRRRKDDFRVSKYQPVNNINERSL
jgi:hypothetical protein